MIKYLVTTSALFVLELVVFIQFQPFFLRLLTSVDPRYLNTSDYQRLAIASVQKIRTCNESRQKALYIFGGSAGNAFFHTDEELGRRLGLEVRNLCSYGQTLLDNIRLADNIQVQGSVVIVTLYPNRFMRLADRKLLVDSKYLMGAAARYPAESPSLNMLLKDVEPLPRDRLLCLLPALNVYASVAGEHFSYHVLANQGWSAFFTAKNALHFQLNLPPRGEESFNKILDASVYQTPRDSSLDIKNNFIYLEKLLLLCGQKNIGLVLFELPYSKNVAVLTPDSIALYEKSLAEFKARHPEAPCVTFTGKIPKDEYRYFYDYYHVAPAGRAYFDQYQVNGLLYASQYLQ